MLENVLEKINFNSYIEFVKKVRRELHQYPELGFELEKTIEIVKKYLDEIGVEYLEKIGKSGIVAEIKGETSTNITIAIRADMDALPIKENNQIEYKSKIEGNMHACGHDAHTAILIGIIKVLKDISKLPCNVRFIFQPAEETTGGAKPMIEDGVLKNVDCIFGLHVDPTLSCGKIGINYGARNASSTDIVIEVEGKSCHGAYPSEGVDAILVMANILCSLQSIISRNIDSRESLVVSIGKINGGTKENIVAQNSICSGTIRSLSKKTLERGKLRIKELVENIAKAYGGIGKVKFKDSYIALINHDDYVELVKENGELLLGKENIIIKKEAEMGVEDFAYFVEKIPGVFFDLGVKNEKKGITYPLHNNNFNIDEDALIIGVKLGVLNIFRAYERFKKEGKK